MAEKPMCPHCQETRMVERTDNPRVWVCAVCAKTFKVTA